MDEKTKEIKDYLLKVHRDLAQLGRQDLAEMIMMISISDVGGRSDELYKIMSEFYLAKAMEEENG